MYQQYPKGRNEQSEPYYEPEHDESIDLRAYLRVISRRRWLILSVLLIVTAAVMIKSLTMVPVYRTSAQILIERANPNVLSTEELLAINPSGQDFYQTQYKILESRTLARDVIRRTNLVHHPEFRNDTDKGASPFAFIDDYKRQLKGLIKGIFRKERVPEPDVLEGQTYPITAAPHEDDSELLRAFQERVHIEPIRNSRLVNVGFDSIYPNLAARVSNTIVQAYIDWNLGIRLKSQQEASRFLDEQVKSAKRKLEATELALQQYREKYGVSVISSRNVKDGGMSQDLSRQKLQKVNEQLLDATNRRIETEIRYRQAAALLKDPEKAETISAVVTNPIIISIKEQEVQLFREKAEKAQKYGRKHPIMIALNQEIAKVERQKMQEIRNIVDAMRGDYEIAKSQELSLKKALGVSQDETINRDKIAIQYQVLQQEVESNRSLYDMLLKRMKETSVSEENRSVNIHVIDRAEVPKDYYTPKLKRNLLLAIMVGLFLGIGLAFLMEFLDDTVKDPGDLERLFGLPYLGPVPHFSHNNGDDPMRELITVNEPHSVVSESYRGLRTGILFSTPGGSPKTVLVTSSSAGEGKTTTAANLAVTMAQAGSRVLLIDADMRKPRLHRIFGGENKSGLSNILVGEGEWSEYLVKTDVENLKYIPVGPIPPNPSELLGSKRMQEMMQVFLETYERVIIDSPPVSAVTDPIVLSRLVDGVVVVINAGKATIDQVSHAQRQLRGVNAHVLGAVLNNIDTKKDGYYYNYHYYSYYHTEDGDHNKSSQNRSKRKA